MRLLVLVPATLALVLAGPPAGAASLVLTERDRHAALLVGQRSVTQEAFGGEWRIENASGESVDVITPFHRLALAARHAAFKNEALKPQEQERMLQELRDRLMFSVRLLGSAPDFARHYKARLILPNGAEVQPVVAQHDHTARRRDDGRYLAHGTYWFPTRDLTGDARVALVVRDSDDRPVARFVVDLGRMR